MVQRKIARNFFSLFLSSVVGQVFTLWGFIHIARVSGPEGFGKFSFAQVILLYFLHLSEFGLQTHGTRAVAQERGRVAEHVATITLLRIILAVGWFLVLLILTLVLPKPVDVKTLIVVFGISLLPSAVLLEWVFQGVERMEYVGVGRVLKGVVFAGLVFAFVREPEHLIYSVVSYSAAIVVAAGTLLVIYCVKFKPSFAKTDWQSIKRTFVLAAPLGAGSIITQINYNFGMLALAFFVSDEEVGIFSAAHKVILFLWAFAVVAASNAILPALATAYKRSTSEFSGVLKNLFRVFVLLALPVAIGGAVLGAPIMNYLYSSDFSESIIVFQISIWVVAIVLYRVIFENALIASQKRRRYFTGFIVAGGITIVGNIALIPILGIIAPSIVGLLSELVLLTYFALSCKFIRWSYALQVSVRPLLAGVIMGVAIMCLNLNLFLMLISGILIYFASLLVLRCVTIGEIRGFLLPAKA
ncbi:MAG: flippase [Bacteroidetes bacterium]|nr:flippase [Bacteroidota bacterium]MCW5895357.1 flippase [Bacteroidota bacterium]